MRILISNDDGIQARGLRSLYAALTSAGHEVRVVAPAAQRSGASSSITAWRPLFAHQVKEGDFEGWAVEGSPADCVLLGLNGLYPDDARPDMVISGINHGPNVGMDVMLSGTVGAAAQGALAGLPSFALSHADVFSDSREQADWLAGFLRTDWRALFQGGVWNINFPACPVAEIKGVKVCRQSLSWPWLGRFEQRTDPYGQPYWWPGEALAHFRQDDPDTDKGWIHRGYITLTPLCFDFTDKAALTRLEQGLQAMGPAR